MRPPSRRPKFAEPRYFHYHNDTKRWRCDVCSPDPAHPPCDSMTVSAALKHEKTREHTENVRAREEWNPTQEFEAWIHGPDGLFESRLTEPMQHVDQLKDFIPFWRRTIEAAEKGETLRFEDYMNTVQEKEQGNVIWNVTIPDWAVEPLDLHDAEHRSTTSAHARLSEPSHGLDSDALDFVEKIARMDSANPERTERLRSFYKMPTSEKVDRIKELINTLRVTQRGS